MAIPPLHQFNTSNFCGDNLHHQRKLPGWPAVGDLPVKLLDPRTQALEQSRRTENHSRANVAHVSGKVVRGFSCGQCLV